MIIEQQKLNARGATQIDLPIGYELLCAIEKMGEIFVVYRFEDHLKHMCRTITFNSVLTGEQVGFGWEYFATVSINRIESHIFK